ncbi:MAG: hypothetical protein MI975_20540 [Cytophagales bacterium]|nr:hypothetical protein [Cytophagales bacterium]
MNTIGANEEPLVVIDGIPGGELDAVDPTSISHPAVIDGKDLRGSDQIIAGVTSGHLIGALMWQICLICPISKGLS